MIFSANLDKHRLGLSWTRRKSFSRLLLRNPDKLCRTPPDSPTERTLRGASHSTLARSACCPSRTQSTACRLRPSHLAPATRSPGFVRKAPAGSQASAGKSRSRSWSNRTCRAEWSSPHAPRHRPIDIGPNRLESSDLPPNFHKCSGKPSKRRSRKSLSRHKCGSFALAARSDEAQLRSRLEVRQRFFPLLAAEVSTALASCRGWMARVRRQRWSWTFFTFIAFDDAAESELEVDQSDGFYSGFWRKEFCSPTWYCFLSDKKLADNANEYHRLDWIQVHQQLIGRDVSAGFPFNWASTLSIVVLICSDNLKNLREIPCRVAHDTMTYWLSSR